MGLIIALDPILVVATLRGQKLHDLEQAAAPAAPVRSGRVMHRLPDLELVVAHVVIRGFSFSTISRNTLRRGAYLLRAMSGSLAMFAAMRRASSRMSRFGGRSAPRLFFEINTQRRGIISGRSDRAMTRARSQSITSLPGCFMTARS
jgi:hypothetical protein